MGFNTGDQQPWRGTDEADLSPAPTQASLGPRRNSKLRQCQLAAPGEDEVESVR